ncbi:hypothetical protein DAI22_09g050900 [Oryza sativa Japonica Group]|nr:hypothetical protein DAI22_09g050900 [Oryza sativa Japonica Group]
MATMDNIRFYFQFPAAIEVHELSWRADRLVIARIRRCWEYGFNCGRHKDVDAGLFPYSPRAGLVRGCRCWHASVCFVHRGPSEMAET